MIQIKEKRDCCGCSACVQVCPKQCIFLLEDKQGFLYPKVDVDSCIDCHRCETVCPFLNQNEPKRPLKVYAATNMDEKIRMRSSSGGIFTLLAESVISEGGVVFGARFNENWEVIHDMADTKEGIKNFRGSKYIQSNIGNTFSKAQRILNEGRKVLFSGTSCQIEGLKNFLRKDYQNLITVDVVCHGVPSPLVWRTYLRDYIRRPIEDNDKVAFLLDHKGLPRLTDISFRDKSKGWKNFGFVIKAKPCNNRENNEETLNEKEKDIIFIQESRKENIYFQLFLKNLSLRPSCFNCPSKGGKCNSDITLGDCWGIYRYYPQIDDDKGLSAVLINSEKGASVFEKLNVDSTEISYKQFYSGNTVVEKPVKDNQFTSLFWDSFINSNFENVNYVLDQMVPSMLQKSKDSMRNFVRLLIPSKLLTFVRRLLLS